MNFLNGAAYIRVSTEDQTEYSPEAQLDAIKKYAADHEISIAPEHIYADEGISGRSAAKRPAFMRMIADAKLKEHPFDIILVHKFDRFARSREDSIVFKGLLKRECNVEVFSVTESINDNGSGMGMLLEAITEAYAEFYSINLSKEVKKGMHKKALKGGVQSTPPFGYRVTNNMFTIDEFEAPLVREIFNRFIAGEGLFPIARDFNARGIRTHRGGEFENRTVEYILRNPVYCGKIRWNPTGRTQRNFDDPNLIIADGKHEPIVTEEIWNKAQKRMREVKAMWGYKAKPTYNLKDWLGGIVRCSSCNSTLIFSKPHYFKCNNYVRGRCSTTQHISVERLHEAVITQLQEDMENVSIIEPRIIYTDPAQTFSNNYLAQIANLEKRKERAKEAYLNGADTIEEYKAYKAKVENEIQKLKSLADNMHKKEDANTIQSMLQNSIREVLATLEAPDETNESKNEALRSIVDTCIYNKNENTLEITYRIQL